jgi:hypothetical protein
MTETPSCGCIVIEWRRVGDAPESADDASEEFDWKVNLEPPGLPDEDVSRLLAEIAERF